MKSLREITVNSLIKTLPKDLMNELMLHYVKQELYLPKIINLEELFYDHIPEDYPPSLDTLNMIETFILTFPMIVKSIENIQEHISSIVHEVSLVSDHINTINEFGYAFIYDVHYPNIYFICKLNGTYYRFFMNNVNDFSIHQSVIKFFEERGLSTEQYVKAFKF